MADINFGGLEDEYCSDKAKIVILPVPYDATSTWIKGADKGPAAMIEASMNMELYDIETDSEVYKQGIFTDSPVREDGSPKAMVLTVKERVSSYLRDGKLPIVIGGEHSVSVGPIKAAAEKFDGLSVLQLDAHTDLRDKYHGSNHSHACVMARAKEVAKIVQVGIRSMDSCELKDMNRSNVFFAEDILKRERESWIKEVVGKLSDDVYITIDLDVFDSSVMPSTGTPEPGGLLWYDVTCLLREVIMHKNLVGFDVVELCPNPNNKAPDFLAAKLIYKILSYKFKGE